MVLCGAGVDLAAGRRCEVFVGDERVVASGAGDELFGGEAVREGAAEEEDLLVGGEGSLDGETITVSSAAKAE